MVSDPPSFQIGALFVGPGQPCFVVAEIAQAHDGSLGTAHAYIDAVARTGANAIKFQTHIALAESTPAEQFRVAFSPQDATRYEYWKRMEFSEEQWAGLARHAREKGLIFMSSPFSIEAVELLERVGVPAWKVGAGEVRSLAQLERIARTGKPVLLSTGMSPWSEIDAAVAAVRRAGAPVAVLQCTSAYPCPPERLGLNVISEIRTRYGCPAGLSDHSGTIHAGLAAVALGANIVEVHAVFSRECFGPDVTSSLTTTELRQLVEGVRFVERALLNPVDKDRESAGMADLRTLFGKSVVAARGLSAGHRLGLADFAFKKPGTGISADRARELEGRTLKRALAADAQILEADLE